MLLFYFVQEYDIEVVGTVRPIFYSPRPISLHIFCKLVIINITERYDQADINITDSDMIKLKINIIDMELHFLTYQKNFYKDISCRNVSLVNRQQKNPALSASKI